MMFLYSVIKEIELFFLQYRKKSEAKPAGQSAKSFSAEDPFLMFETTQGSSYNGASVVDDYLDSLFTSGTQSNAKSSQSATTEVQTKLPEKLCTI